MSWITLKIGLFKVHIETYRPWLSFDINLFIFGNTLIMLWFLTKSMYQSNVQCVLDLRDDLTDLCKVPKLQHQPGMIIVNNNPTLRHILNLPVINFTL